MLGSGSRGNSTLVATERTRLLVDAGFSRRETCARLAAAGERLFARLWPAVERLNRAAVAGLPEAAVDMLRWTLERMRDNLDRDLAAGERVA